MNILVTGGLGFIGHCVVRQLERLGHLVTVVDSQTNYGIVPQDELNYLISERKSKFTLLNFVQAGAGVYLYNNDITDKSKLEHIFNIEQPEIVIHLASFPRQKVVNANPTWGSRVMSEGLLNLLEAAVEYRVKKFVYISSSMVYGNFDNYADENWPCKPEGQYGILKLAGEWLVKDYAQRKDMSYTIVRPSAVYGPLDVEDRVIAKFMMAAMRGQTLKVNGPNERLDFTYVEDAASGIVQASLSDNTKNKTYNITRGFGRTLLQAAELIVDLVGQGKIEINNRDLNFPSRGTLDINAARKDFDFDPIIDLEQGLVEYYNWLQSSSYWQQKLSK